MKTLKLRALLLSVVLALMPAALHAQTTKIFVASFGNDANDGSRGSPKRNFQAAHDGLNAGGEIVVLDTAGYGAVTVTKGLTITCPSGVTGLISASGAGTTAMTISTAAGATVALRGLTIENVGSADNGIAFNGAGTLDLSDCTIQGFNATGVEFKPSVSAALAMRRCTVRNSSSTALNISPTGGTSAASVADSRFDSNTVGGILVVGAHSAALDRCVFANGSRFIEVQSGGSLQAQACTFSNSSQFSVLFFSSKGALQNCAVSKGNGAIYATNSTGTVALKGCNLSFNTTAVTAQSSAVILVDDCVINGNTTAAYATTNGGSILSRSNNTVSNNAAVGPFGTYTAQ